MAAEKTLPTKRPKLRVHYSHNSVEWATPQDFYDELNKKLGPFLLDPCCNADNQKCPFGFHKEITNGLTEDWNFLPDMKVFMNPPYGREIGAWVKKAYEESVRGALVCCLLPARTDTKWFHAHADKANVVFIEGRLKFGKSKTSAPFPSMLFIFHPPPGPTGVVIGPVQYE